jgi:formylglycine-generating enzyme required for sulfatase activity
MRRFGWVALALVILMLAAASAAQAEKRIALLIANQGYSASVGTLKNPFNDIAVVGDALSKQGFEILTPIKDGKRSAMLGGVRDLVRRLNAAGAGAIGFIYYSGHGAAEKDTNINYLIPVDASAPGTSAFWDDSVKLDDVLRLLDGARSAAKFIVFDACRNELQLPTKDTSKGLVPVAEQQGMFIAYASAPGRTASDMGDKSGPYAAALAVELAHPGLDHLNLFQNVKETVLASTGGVQQPWESNGLGRRVYLTGPPAAAAPTSPSSTATTQQSGWSTAEREWQQYGKETKDIRLLEAFKLKHKSDPVYVRLAEARSEELKRQEIAASVAAPTLPDAPLNSEPNRPPVKWEKVTEGTSPTPASKPRAEPKTPEVTWERVVNWERMPATKCDGIEITVGQNERRCFKPGAGRTEYFKDCPTCPEMVAVPKGSFTMGSPPNEPQRVENEAQVRITIAAPFAVGKYSVTFDEWDTCVANGGCNGYKPDDQGWGRSKHPVINVNWDDAKAYVSWLSRKTGKSYRLLSEAEREYVTRAGTTTPFWWGSSITSKQANRPESFSYKEDSKGYGQRTLPVDNFEANPWGLYQVHGNVYEWTEDCWNESNAGNPGDGSARASGDCSVRVIRGGSWSYMPALIRSAARGWRDTGDRIFSVGFRVARTLAP